MLSNLAAVRSNCGPHVWNRCPAKVSRYCPTK